MTIHYGDFRRIRLRHPGGWRTAGRSAERSADDDRDAGRYRGSLPEQRPVDEILARSSAWFPHRFFVSLRLTTRSVEAFTAWQLGGPQVRLLLLAAVGCALFDVALSMLARRRRLPWVPRLLLDVADVTSWSLALPGAADLAAVAAVPLAVETGLVFGSRNLVVPALVCGVDTVVLRLDGLPAGVTTWVWPVTGAIGSLVARRYLEARCRDTALTARWHAEAAAGRAELSGQSSVAMAADSVLDLLIRTAPLVAAYEPTPGSSPVAGWKAALAQVCGRESSYLGVTLIQWQRLYNSRHPDLSHDVDIRLMPGAGTLLLSPAQVRHLAAALEARRPRGRIQVSILRPAPVGRAQVILVAGEPVVLPADPVPAARLPHAAPVLLVFGAALTLSHALPSWDGVPPWAAGPLAAALLGLGWWTHERHGGPGPTWMLLAAALLGGADAVVSTVLARPESGRFPFLTFLLWVGPLALFHLRDLRREARIGVLALIVAGVAAGGALSPAALTPGAVLPALLWPLASILCVLGLRDVLEGDTADLRADLARQHDAAVSAGHRRGRQLVIELTWNAMDDLRRRYAALRAGLPSDVAEEVDRRLEQARVGLATISGDNYDE
jgi:hypothetical protein